MRSWRKKTGRRSTRVDFGALALDQFDALIRTELGLAERIVQHGVPRDKVYSLVCEAD